MIRLMVSLLALTALFGHTLRARDLTGQWQGTLHVESGLRLILKVQQTEAGKLTATFSSIDQSPEEFPVTSISLEGSKVKFSVDLFRGRYEGTLSDDGTSISGQWFGPRTPGSSLPLDYHLATGAAKWPQESSPHTTQFITVDHDVRLEVLDWGGTGRPVVLLAGLGNTAHVFDRFAPKLTATYHVYGITRRGFGASSAPEPANGNYSADRLGDDVLEVMDALKLDRPVLIGHSIAGEELSSIGSRHPEKVSGLVYLDAGYAYAYYDAALGDLSIDANKTRRDLLRLTFVDRNSKAVIQGLLQADLPQLVKSLEKEQKELNAESDAAILADEIPKNLPSVTAARAILEDARKYTQIKCPVLAFFAVAPISAPGSTASPSARTDAARAEAAAQAKAFETGVPSAKVIRLQNADHYVFSSNEAEVLRDINDFIAHLP